MFQPLFYAWFLWGVPAQYILPTGSPSYNLISGASYLTPPGGCNVTLDICGGDGGFTGINAQGGAGACFTVSFWGDGVSPFIPSWGSGGGFYGGGFGTGGGSCSAVTSNATTLAVAGGGGGAGYYSSGSASSGGSAGLPGSTASGGSGPYGGAGFGGSQLGPGGSINPTYATTQGSPGSGRSGGAGYGGTGTSYAGINSVYNCNGGGIGTGSVGYGGGGGGGWFGGGGGSGSSILSGTTTLYLSAGGGGGSSYVAPSVSVSKARRVARTCSGAGNCGASGEGGFVKFVSCAPNFCPPGTRCPLQSGCTAPNQCIVCGPGLFSASGASVCAPTCPPGTQASCPSPSLCPGGTTNTLLRSCYPSFNLVSFCTGPPTIINLNTMSSPLMVQFGEYSSELKCSAIFVSPNGTTLSLTFVSFSTEPRSDFFFVGNTVPVIPSSSLIPWSGQKTITGDLPPSFDSTSNAFEIMFTSDKNNNACVGLCTGVTALVSVSCSAGTFGLPDGFSPCYLCPTASNYSTDAASSCAFTAFSCPPSTYAVAPSACRKCSTGAFSNAAGASGSCTQCSAGKYADEVGSRSCKPCPANSYSFSGASDCISQCPAGNFANTSSLACLPCTQGTFSVSPGAKNSCKSTCDLGFYVSATGRSSNSSCFPCGSGLIQTVLGQPCISCQAGKYKFNNTYCAPCAIGSSSTAGASGCSPCSRNFYQNTTGGAVCYPCPISTFSSAGAGVCCGLGNWSTPGTTQCTPCLPGSASNIQGAVSQGNCTNCSLGYFNPYSGMSSCQFCPGGQYAPTTGATSCLTCLAGFFSSAAWSSCPPCSYSTSSGYSIAGSSSCSYTASTCPKGTFASTGQACALCPRGTYNSVAGLNAASQCTLCPINTYSANPGEVSSNACLNCPTGFFSSQGSISLANCSACAPGLTTLAGGGCGVCPLGSFCQGGDTNLCPAGRYGNSTGLASPSDCLACPVGSSVSTTGSVSPISCAPCLIGYFQDTPGSATCQACPSGTAGTAPGATDKSICVPCSQGLFSSSPGSSSCTGFCPLGKAGVKPGGVSEADACELCPPGSFTSQPQAAVCTPCQKGAYAEQPGSTACTLCPLNAYSVASGGTSPSNCTSCPGGTGTTTQGASDPAQCVIQIFKCPQYKQPRVPIPAPKTLDDCADLVCPPPLTQDPLGFGCKGCPPGSYFDTSSDGGGGGGVPNTCTPCPSNTSCSGFLTTPLVSNPGTLAAIPSSSSSGGSSSPSSPLLCSSLTALPATLTSLTPGPFNYFSTLPLAIMGGGFFIGSVFIGAYLLSQRLGHTRAGRGVEGFLKYFDSFASSHLLREGQVTRHAASTLGGMCSVLSVLTLVVFGAVQVARFATSNSYAISTLNTATLATTPFKPTVPFAAPLGASVAALHPPLPPNTVLQFRVFAQKELGCALGAGAGSSSSGGSGSGINTSPTPFPMSVVGLSSGQWTQDSQADCGGGGGGGGVGGGAPSTTPFSAAASDTRSLLTLTCTSCVFTASASLTLTLPYTCQALYLEALAVDAGGEVQTLAFDPFKSGATTSAMLTSLTWTLDPMATLLTDTIKGSSTRGVRLLGSTAVNTLGAPPGGLIQPLAAAIPITFALGLEPSFSTTTITQQTSLVELLSSLIGLVGIVGFFRVLFQYVEFYLRDKGGGEGSGKAVLGGLGVGEEGEGERGKPGSGGVAATTAATAATTVGGGSGVGSWMRSGTHTPPSSPTRRPSLYKRFMSRWRRPSSMVAGKSPGGGGSEGGIDNGGGGVTATVVNPLRGVGGGGGGGVTADTTATTTLPGAPSSTAPLTQWLQHSDGTDTWYSSVPGGEVVWKVPEGGVVVTGAGAPGGVTWAQHQEGSTVWYVSSAGETAWELPEGATVSFQGGGGVFDTAGAAAPGAVSGGEGVVDTREPPPGWTRKVSKKSGSVYFFQKATGKTSWEYPE